METRGTFCAMVKVTADHFFPFVNLSKIIWTTVMNFLSMNRWDRWQGGAGMRPRLHRAWGKGKPWSGCRLMNIQLYLIASYRNCLLTAQAKPAHQLSHVSLYCKQVRFQKSPFVVPLGDRWRRSRLWCWGNEQGLRSTSAPLVASRPLQLLFYSRQSRDGLFTLSTVTLIWGLGLNHCKY